MEHFAKHFNESGSGIRFVLDIYIFLEAKKKELHPEYLKKKQKELGLEEFCREMEEIAYRWFDGRPEIRDSKYETVILLAGIFGIRQWAYAGQQKKYLEKYKNPRIAKGMYLLGRLFPDYHAMAAQYPFLRKLPVLLPVTWILRALRLIKTRRTVIKGELGALKNNIK